MNILDQIKQALSEMGFAAQPEITAVRAQLNKSEADRLAEHDDFKAQLAGKDADILKLIAELEKAQGEVNAQGNEIKALGLKLAEAEKKTEEALSAMGVPAATIPAAPAANVQAGDLQKQLDAITDPVARARFFKQHKAALIAGALRKS